jgi:ATP-dependent RNA helicase DHX57
LATLYPKGKAVNFNMTAKENIKGKFSNNRDIAQVDQLKSKRILEEYKTILDSINYQNILKNRKKLPSFLYKENICKELRENQKLIICGETGCGKSTQIGQFILEDMILKEQGANVNIICTQPRRISAISLAERVAKELNDEIGNLVGYSIRGESKQTAETKILFCTTGVLLRMIQSDAKLKSISHIIVDEVHERGGKIIFKIS